MALALPFARLGHDGRVIVLIASAHFFSHLYLLVLPPIFPLLREDLGVSYASLGIALAIPNIATGLLQSPIGFVVDRLGAPRVLIAGQIVMALAIALIGVFPSYEMLLVLMLVAGIGNAVYHPADYAILAGAVSDGRSGRAFSIHTFGGFAGFAMAPLLVITLTEWQGWPIALIVLGSAGLMHAFWIWGSISWLGAAAGRRPQRQGEGGWRNDINFLMSRPILMALAFFALIAMIQSGFLGFSVAVLEITQGSSLQAANLSLSIFLWLSAFGVLAGGWIADGTGHHDAVAAVCFTVTAVMALLLASVAVEGLWLGVVLGLAGFAGGAVSPSRDMLVRAVTPPGSSGKVFGFVTTGFNIGGLLAPPLFGLMIDLGHPSLVFWAVGALALLAILLARATIILKPR